MIAWVHVDAEITALPDGSFAMIGMVGDRHYKTKRVRGMSAPHGTALFDCKKAYTADLWEFDVKNSRVIQTNDSQEIHGYGKVVENVPGKSDRRGICAS